MFESNLEYQIEDVQEFRRNLKYINNYMEQDMYAWSSDNQSHFHGHQLYCK